MIARGWTDMDNAERLAEYVGNDLYWLNDVRLWILKEGDHWGLYTVREQAPIVAIVFRLARELPTLEGHHYDREMTSLDGGVAPSEYEEWFHAVVHRLGTYPGARSALGQLRAIMSTTTIGFITRYPEHRVVPAGVQSRKSVVVRGLNVLTEDQLYT